MRPHLEWCAQSRGLSGDLGGETEADEADEEGECGRQERLGVRRRRCRSGGWGTAVGGYGELGWVGEVGCTAGGGDGWGKGEFRKEGGGQGLG